jgi:hypothetical protein
MTDQLISLETAILAKEKGYNQNPYKTANAYGPEFKDGSNVHLRSSSLFNPDSNTAVAPTQSLLQKWLREVHDTHITIYCFAQDGWGFDIAGAGLKQKPNNWADHTPHKRGFSNYEKALEQGLIEALKLIS